MLTRRQVGQAASDMSKITLPIYQHQAASGNTPDEFHNIVFVGFRNMFALER